jgi:hypothetical protein
MGKLPEGAGMKWEKMFGGPLDIKTEAEIKAHDWRYKTLDSDASNSVVIDLLHRLEGRSFSIAGENTGRWQKGWQENFEDFRRTDDLKALEPKYLRPAKVLRLDGQFIEPADPMFEANWYSVFRGWFAWRYLSGFDHIYEFGCGSGHNLVFLAQEFPGKHIHGYDWADASFRIIDRLRSHFPNIGGGRFDFFEPHTLQPFMPNSAVLTIGAMEQTGTRWRPFLEFVRRSQPAMCFHIEPMLEWYDPANLVDYTAIKIHEARGFWRGFANEVVPLGGHRTGFGSLLLEGYSQIQWSPNPTLTDRARIDALEGAP